LDGINFMDYSHKDLTLKNKLFIFF
jgi:hypothetical protein